MGKRESKLKRPVGVPSWVISGGILMANVEGRGANDYIADVSWVVEYVLVIQQEVPGDTHEFDTKLRHDGDAAVGRLHRCGI